MSRDLPEELKQKVILSTSFVSGGGGAEEGLSDEKNGSARRKFKKRKKEKKKNLIRTKILFCTCGLTFFPPLRGDNSKITTQLLSYQNSSFQKVRCRPAFYIAAPQALTSDKALLHHTRFYFVPMYMLFEGDCSIFSYRN